NSPNRVMPGRLVERIRSSDKLAGGLHPGTPKLISRLYNHIVTNGTVYETNSLTAEIVKTLENAYRDVRIAFSTEIVRYCDKHDVDFYLLRDKVNQMLAQEDNASSDPNAVPSGGMLVPMLGVGGHCLPKDGILLWWRSIESGIPTSHSLILNSRIINDESPVYTFKQAEEYFGSLNGKKIALLGVAYRFNSEDTRNSPTLSLANYLQEHGYSYQMHDPHVKHDDQNLLRYKQQDYFTNNLDEVLANKDFVIMCTAHGYYLENVDEILGKNNLTGIMDACNIYNTNNMKSFDVNYHGIGRGGEQPPEDFLNFVFNSFTMMEKGLGYELQSLVDFYNRNYAFDDYNKVDFKEVQRLARTCSTGCVISDPGEVVDVPVYNGFCSSLLAGAKSGDQKYFKNQIMNT
ncbi:MAG: UDP binding domain-containing protein, partial [Bacteroidota bacterium]